MNYNHIKPEVLTDYLSDELSAQAKHEADAHLAVCTECAARLEAERAFRNRIQSAYPKEFSEILAPAGRIAVSREANAPDAGGAATDRPLWEKRIRNKFIVQAAAILVVGGLLCLMILPGGKKTSPIPPPDSAALPTVHDVLTPELNAPAVLEDVADAAFAPVALFKEDAKPASGAKSKAAPHAQKATEKLREPVSARENARVASVPPAAAPAPVPAKVEQKPQSVAAVGKDTAAKKVSASVSAPAVAVKETTAVKASASVSASGVRMDADGANAGAEKAVAVYERKKELAVSRSAADRENDKKEAAPAFVPPPVALGDIILNPSPVPPVNSLLTYTVQLVASPYEKDVWILYAEAVPAKGTELSLRIVPADPKKATVLRNSDSVMTAHFSEASLLPDDFALVEIVLKKKTIHFPVRKISLREDFATALPRVRLAAALHALESPAVREKSVRAKIADDLDKFAADPLYKGNAQFGILSRKLREMK